jgi:hypothetical protein
MPMVTHEYPDLTLRTFIDSPRDGSQGTWQDRGVTGVGV